MSEITRLDSLSGFMDMSALLLSALARVFFIAPYMAWAEVATAAYIFMRCYVDSAEFRTNLRGQAGGSSRYFLAILFWLCIRGKILTELWMALFRTIRAIDFFSRRIVWTERRCKLFFLGLLGNVTLHQPSNFHLLFVNTLLRVPKWVTYSVASAYFMVDVIVKVLVLRFGLQGFESSLISKSREHRPSLTERETISSSIPEIAPKGNNMLEDTQI